MVTLEIRRKTLLLLALTLLLCGVQLHAAWQMELVYSAVISGGTTLSDNAVLGEHANALEGYDYLDIVMLGAPPMNPSYVRSYFPHTDWGAYYCNLKYDIRSANIATKTWVLTLNNSNVTSSNYSIAWTIPASLPNYYQPKLIINSTTYNMRNQSSYQYSSPVSSCQIRLDVSPGMPYLLSNPPALSFSNNLPQSLNLAQYFGVTSGSLSYSFEPNAHLVQSLVTINDTLRWRVYPVHGFLGSTTATIVATGSGGSISANIQVSRDDSNSSPQYNDSPPQLTMQQNSSVLFSWVDKISDADLDDWDVSLDGGVNFSAEINTVLHQATITANPGYKGSDTLSLVISDSVSPELVVPVHISVLPSIPAVPQNFTISPSGHGSICLSWNPVETDLSGLPLTGVTYRVLCYSDAACNVLSNSFAVDLPQICLTASQSTQFYKVKSINE